MSETPAETARHLLAALAIDTRGAAARLREYINGIEQENANLRAAANYGIEVMRDNLSMRAYKNEVGLVDGMEQLGRALGWPGIHPPNGVYLTVKGAER
jgi:hypothetical protein